MAPWPWWPCQVVAREAVPPATLAALGEQLEPGHVLVQFFEEPPK